MYIILAWNEFEKRKCNKDSRELKDYCECNADVLLATKLCKLYLENNIIWIKSVVC